MNGYQIGALAGLEAYRPLAVAGLAQGMFQLVVCGLFTWMWGLEGALIGLLASSLTRWLIFHLALSREAAKQKIVVGYSSPWQERQILARFAVPAAVSGISSGPAIWLANTFLARQTGGYSQLALFSAAFNLKNIVMFLPLLLNNVGMALLNNQRGARDELQYRNVFWMNLKLTGSSVLVGAICMAALGERLLTFYGRTFKDAYPTLLVLLGSSVIEALAIAFYQVIQSRERMWLSLLMIALPRDIAFVALARFLVPAHGALGLSIAQVISWLGCTVVILILVNDLGLNLGDSGVTAERQEIIGL
jgi:O-antigen/teichoic acid export membrane protein